MLNKFARAIFTRLLTPIAAFLLRIGISPDAITIIGTIGVCIGALVLYPTGHLLIGTIVITVFVLSDMLDGIMARLSERSSVWGAFLDSTLDRFGDSAVFCGIALWYFFGGNSRETAMLALACLILGSIVSYARARAEGLGLKAAGGVAERADRLLLTLTFTGFVGLGLPRMFLTVVLAILALASMFTIWQRMSRVRGQIVLAQQSEAVAAQRGRARTEWARKDRPNRGDTADRDTAGTGTADRDAAGSGTANTGTANTGTASSDTELTDRWDEWKPESDGMLARSAARVIVIDDDGRTLLLKGHDTDDADHRWWFTVGGGLLDGEDPRSGAARELREETGIDIAPSDLVGPLARRSSEFVFATKTVRQHEQFFAAHVPAGIELATSGWTDLERETLDEFRWWSVDEIRSSRETVYPLQLADVIEWVRVGSWDGGCRVID